MATKTRFHLTGKGRDSYLELVLAFPLSSIRSDAHLDEAQQVLDRLLAKGKLDEGDQTYLDALSDLVADYEDRHHGISPRRMPTCCGICWTPRESLRRS